MDADGIQQVLRDVFGRGLKTQRTGGWLAIQCPLAPYTHTRGADRRPSAGISIQPEGTSIFNCYTCGNTSPFHGMLRKYAEFTGEDLDDVIGEVEEHAYLGPKSLPDWDSWRDRETMAEQQELDPAIYLDLYESAKDHPYLDTRGVSPDTAEMLQLMVDPEDPADGEERILFPTFDAEGKLRGLSGRAVQKTAKLKVRDYHGFEKNRNLLGIHLIDPKKHKYVCLVEGLIDYASGWECGQPTVAAMHSTLTRPQAEILVNLGLPVYVFSDNDEAGAKMVSAAGKMISKHAPVLKVRWPERWIEDDSDEGGHWLKDPGELMPDEWERMVQDARLY